MVETALVEHRIANRMRLRIASKRGHAAYFETVVAALAQFDEVREVLANPATGSILLHLDGSPARVLERAREEDLFQIEEKRPGARRKPTRTGVPAPLPGPTGAGFLALGLLQLGRGEVVGPATESFWNARLAATTLGRPWLAALLATAGCFQLARGRVLGSAVSLLIYAVMMQERGGAVPETASANETVAKH